MTCLGSGARRAKLVKGFTSRFGVDKPEWVDLYARISNSGCGHDRDNSTDSRVLSSVGYVPLDNVIGRVGLIFFSSAGEGDGRAERIGTTVR